MQLTKEQIIDFLKENPKTAKEVMSQFNPQTGKKRAAPPPASPPPNKKIDSAQNREKAEQEAEERAARFALSRSQNTTSAVFSSNSARAELKRKELATQQQNDIDKLKKDIEESQNKLLESHVKIEDEFKTQRKKSKDFLIAYPLIKANIGHAYNTALSKLKKIRNTFETDTNEIISWISTTPERISDFCKQFTLLEKQATKDTSDFKKHTNLIIRSVELMSKIAVSNVPHYIVEEFNKLATCTMDISDHETIKSLNQALENWLSKGNTGTTGRSPLLNRLLSRPAAPGRRTVKQSELNAYTITVPYRKYLINFLLMNLHDTTRGMYVAPGVKETAARNVEHYKNKIQKITEQQIAATTDKKEQERLQEKLRKQENKKEEQEQLLKTLTANHENYNTLYALVDTELKKPENHNLIKIIYHFCKNKDMSEKFKQRRSKEIAAAKKKSIISDQELGNPTKNTMQIFIDKIRYLCEQIVVVENDVKPAAAAEPAAPVVNKKLKTD